MKPTLTVHSEVLHTKAALQRRIAQDQQQVQQAFQELCRVVRRNTDLGRWTSKRPYLWLLGGWVCGLMWGLRKGPLQTVREALWH